VFEVDEVQCIGDWPAVSTNMAYFPNCERDLSGFQSLHRHPHTTLPIQSVPVFRSVGKIRRKLNLTAHLHVVPSQEMCGYTPPVHITKPRDVLYVTLGQLSYLNLQAVLFEDCPSFEDS
jgi:hypothetical protein